MTARDIYYVDGTSGKYVIHFNDKRKLTQSETLDMIYRLGQATVLENGHGVGSNGHIKNMMLVDLDGEQGYASTVTAPEANVTECVFYEGSEDNGDKMIELFNDAGLRMNYPTN